MCSEANMPQFQLHRSSTAVAEDVSTITEPDTFHALLAWLDFVAWILSSNKMHRASPFGSHICIPTHDVLVYNLCYEEKPARVLSKGFSRFSSASVMATMKATNLVSRLKCYRTTVCAYEMNFALHRELTFMMSPCTQSLLKKVCLLHNQDTMVDQSIATIHK